MAWRRRRDRTLDLAVLHAETAQLQVEALRAELVAFHQQQARRDVELVAALTRFAAVTDALRLHVDAEHFDQMRLTRAVDRMAMFLTAPAFVTAPSIPSPADNGAGAIIGGTVDPSRASQGLRAPDSTIDLTERGPDPPVAPATQDERPLDCEVHLQFGDRWIDGFQIEETIRIGTVTQFRLRRQVDGWVLPELFEESEVRVFTRPVVDSQLLP